MAEDQLDSTAPDPDPDPPATEETPADPTTTEVPPTAGSDDNTSTGDTHSDDEYTKQLQNQYETDIKRSEAHAHDQQQYIDNIQQQQADIANTPKPQMQQQQMPPAGQDQKGQVTQRVLQVLAIAGVAFSLFGRRRNGYAQGALMGGLGSLIQGYMHGNEEKHKADTANWHQLNQSIHAENQQRMQEYKDILANKKLNMSQQMELMRMKGQFYQSNRMETNAQKQDLAAIHKHITDMEKWQSTHRANAIMSKADHDNWRALVLEKSGGKADINTPDGSKWAFDNYPPSQYFNDKKSARKTDSKTGKQSGGFSGKDKKPDEESDDPLNLGIHKKPDSQKEQPSVLGGGDTGGW